MMLSTFAALLLAVPATPLRIDRYPQFPSADVAAENWNRLHADVRAAKELGLPHAEYEHHRDLWGYVRAMQEAKITTQSRIDSAYWLRGELGDRYFDLGIMPNLPPKLTHHQP